MMSSVSVPAKIITPHVSTPSPPQDDNPFELSLGILEIYKTKNCDRKECIFHRQKVHESDPLLQNECISSHNKGDLRRPPFAPAPGKKGRFLLNYSQYFSPEFTKNQITKSSSDKHCLNDYEYLYHPLNYKTKPCEIAKGGGFCKSHFCVYFHSPEEEQFFENYRKKFDQTVNLFPSIEEIQKNLLRLSNILKKPEEQQARARSVTPDRSPKNSTPPQVVPVNPQVKPKEKAPNEEYYILDQSVKFIEDHQHEFKKAFNFDSVLRYICGFLNSKGGIIYNGISDNGVIKGTEFKELEIPSFKKKLYESLKKFTPPVSEDEVKVNFCPVYKYSKEQGLSQLQNLYVLEFLVKKPAKSDIYFTHIKECYARRAASLNLLKTKEIRYLVELL